jgi:hypothetical protein
MSKNANRQILEEAKVFLESMIEDAKGAKEQGEDIQGMAYLPIRRKAYVDAITTGMGGKVRFHGKDGEENMEINIAPHETVNEVLVDHDLEEGVQGTPVFSIPLFEDKEIWNMSIAMGINLLKDVKFITVITEAWASKKSFKHGAPSEDPDRTEMLVGWSLSFGEKGKVIGMHSHMQEFEVKNSKIKWREPMIDFNDDPREIIKQPQVAEIISRID